MQASTQRTEQQNNSIMEHVASKTKKAKKAPAKTAPKTEPKKVYKYLKGYRELTDDPWGLRI